MPDSIAADLRSRSRLLFAAAIAMDLAGVATLVVPILQGTDLMRAVPLAVLLFMGAAGLILAAVSTKKKADAAEADA